jgi:hypothetical protein
MKGRWIGFGCALVIALLVSSFKGTASGLEIPDIKACEVVTGEEVAALAGATMLVKPGSVSFFCNYVVEKKEGGVESYQLTFESPDTAKLLLDNISGAKKGEKVDGVLDEAYIGMDAMDSQIELRAVRQGKIGMTVTGDRKEVVLQIAKLAVTRLPDSIPLTKM